MFAVPAVVTVEPPEEDFRQEHHGEGLEKSDLPEAKEGRHEPVPQVHDREPEGHHRRVFAGEEVGDPFLFAFGAHGIVDVPAADLLHGIVRGFFPVPWIQWFYKPIFRDRGAFGD